METSPPLTPQSIFDKFTRLWNGISQDDLNLMAAGIAFYFLMAVFPALAAAISLFGIFSDPAIISDHINLLEEFLPHDVVSIFSNQAHDLMAASGKSLGVGFAISVLLAIFSSTKGVNALIQGLNVVYKEKEKRNYFTRMMTGYTLTFILLIYMLAALGLVAVLPAAVTMAPLLEQYADILLALRWPILAFTALVGLETMYLFGPSHSKPRWHWISWGSLLATTLWLVMSSLFSAFITHFGKYNETYGSISAIIILLLWFWMSAMTILLGAEINESFQEPKERKKKKNRKNLDTQGQIS